MMRRTHKTPACLLLVFYFLSEIAGAAPLQPRMNPVSPAEVNLPQGFHLEIPQELGSIDELSSGSGPAVIHIQDAHGSRDAQEKIRQILHHLKNSFGVDLLFMEGASSKLQPELLRFFPGNMDLTLDIARDLKDRALVKGPELFLLEADGVEAFGIENVEAYRRNAAAFREVLQAGTRSRELFERIDLRIERQMSLHLNKDLRDFLKQREALSGSRGRFEAWLDFLKQAAGKTLQTDLEHPYFQIEWPMLVRIFTLKRLEKIFDAGAYRKERPRFLDLLHRYVNGELYESIENLLAETPAQHRLSDPETGRLFEAMIQALPQNFRYGEFPQVNLFIGRLILQSELHGGKLFEETGHLETLLLDELAVTEKEEQIVQLVKDYELLGKLYALELSREGYDELLSRREELKPSAFLDRLDRISEEQNGDAGDIRSAAPELDALYEKAEGFYRGTRERDESMLANLTRRLSLSGKKAAVVVTGGFHAGPFQDYFESRGYSYARITPEAGDVAGHEDYLAVMQQALPDALRLPPQGGGSASSQVMVTSLMEAPDARRQAGEDDSFWVPMVARSVVSRLQAAGVREAQGPWVRASAPDENTALYILEFDRLFGPAVRVEWDAQRDTFQVSRSELRTLPENSPQWKGPARYGMNSEDVRTVFGALSVDARTVVRENIRARVDAAIEGPLANPQDNADGYSFRYFGSTLQQVNNHTGQPSFLERYRTLYFIPSDGETGGRALGDGYREANRLLGLVLFDNGEQFDPDRTEALLRWIEAQDETPGESGAAFSLGGVPGTRLAVSEDAAEVIRAWVTQFQEREDGFAGIWTAEQKNMLRLFADTMTEDDPALGIVYARTVLLLMFLDRTWGRLSENHRTVILSDQYHLRGVLDLSVLENGYAYQYFQVRRQVLTYLLETFDRYLTPLDWTNYDLTPGSRILYRSQGWLVRQLSAGAPAYSLDYSPDGRRAAIATRTHAAIVSTDPESTEEPVIFLNGREDVPPVSIAYSPDGLTLVTSAQNERFVRLWNNDGTPKGVLTTGTEPVWIQAVHFSPDGKKIAGEGSNGRILIWDAAEPNRPPVSLEAHTIIDGLSFAPDGRRLASSGYDGRRGTQRLPGRGTIRVHDLQTGTSRTIRSGLESPAVIAFSPDGEHIAAGSAWGDISILDAESGELHLRLLRPYDLPVFMNVISLAYSPDGQYLSASYLTGAVLIWNPAGSQYPVTALAGGAVENQIRFSPTGRQMASAGNNGSVHIWDAVENLSFRAIDYHRSELRDFPEDSSEWRGPVRYGLDGEDVREVFNRLSGEAKTIVRRHIGAKVEAAIKGPLSSRQDNADGFSFRYFGATMQQVNNHTGQPSFFERHREVYFVPSDGESEGPALGDAYREANRLLGLVLFNEREQFDAGRTEVLLARISENEQRAVEQAPVVAETKFAVAENAASDIRLWVHGIQDRSDRLAGALSENQKKSLLIAADLAAESPETLGIVYAQTALYLMALEAMWNSLLAEAGRVPDNVEEALEETLAFPWNEKRDYFADFLEASRRLRRLLQELAVEEDEGAIGMLREDRMEIIRSFELMPPSREMKDSDSLVVRFSPDGKEAYMAGAYRFRREKIDGSGPPVVQSREDGEIGAIALSPDGTRLASVIFGDGTVNLWDTAESEEPLAVLTAPDDDTFRQVQFSPDGNFLAIVGDTGRIYRLDVYGQKPYETVGSLDGWLIRQPGFSQDGRLLAVLGDDEVAILNADGTGVPAVINPGLGFINAFALSPEGKRIAVTGAGGRVRIIDTESSEPLGVLTGDGSALSHLSFSPDGQWVTAWSSGFGTMWIWKLDGSGLSIALRGLERVSSSAFAPLGDAIAVSNPRDRTQLWEDFGNLTYADRSGRSELREGEGPAAEDAPETRFAVDEDAQSSIREWVHGIQARDVFSGLLGESQKQLLLFFADMASAEFAGPGSKDPETFGIVYAQTVLYLMALEAMWESLLAEDGTVPENIRAALESSLAFSWEEARDQFADFLAESRRLRNLLEGLAAGHPDLPEILRQYELMPVSRELPDRTSMEVLFSPDGRKLLLTRLSSLQIRNADGSGDAITKKYKSLPVTGVSVSPDGARIASTTSLDEVVLWSSNESARPLNVFKIRGQGFTTAFSPDGKRVAAAGNAGLIYFWNVSGAGRRAVLRDFEGWQIHSLAFSPDGRRIAASGLDEIGLRNVDGTGSPLVITTGQGIVNKIAFSPDGLRIASAGDDGTVRIMNADGTGEPAVFEAGETQVRNISFSPDGLWLAVSFGPNQPVRIWKLDGSGMLITLRGTERDSSVAFSPDGERIATSGVGSSRIWESMDLLTYAARPARSELRSKDEAAAESAAAPETRFAVDEETAYDIQRWVHAIQESEEGVAGILNEEQKRNLLFFADMMIEEPDHAGIAYAQMVLYLMAADQLLAQFRPGSVQMRHAEEVLRNNLKLPVEEAREAAGDFQRESRILLELVEELVDRDEGRSAILQNYELMPAFRDLDDHESKGVRFSKDGREIFLASDEDLRWGAIDGSQPLASQQRIDQRSQRIELSPDGQRMISIHEYGTGHLWDIADTRAPLALLGDPEDTYLEARFSPDGRRLVLLRDGGRIRISDVYGPAQEQRLGFLYGANVLSPISPDGRLIAAAAGEVVAIFNVDGTGTPTYLPTYGEHALSLAFSPDSRRIAVAGFDQSVRVYNVDGTGWPAVFQANGAYMLDVSFSPDGRWIAAVQADSNNSKTWLWKLDGSGTSIILRGARGPLARFSPGGDRIVTPVRGGKTRIWENFDHLTYAARPARSELRSEDEAAAESAAVPETRFAVDEETAYDIQRWVHAIQESEEGVAGILNEEQKRNLLFFADMMIEEPDHAGIAYAQMVLYLLAADQLLAQFRPGSVQMRHAEEVLRNNLKLPVEEAREAAGDFQRESRILLELVEELVDRDEGRSAILQNYELMPAFRELDDYESQGVRFSKDGREIFLAGAGGLRSGNIDSGEPLANRPFIVEDSRSMKLSPDGQRMISTHLDGSIHLWNTAGSVEPLAVFEDPAYLFWDGWFSPDGRFLALSRDDGRILISDVYGPRQNETLHTFNGWNIMALAFSPDGRRIAVEGAAELIAILNTDGTGTPAFIPAYGGHAQSLAFSPDGRRIAVAGFDQAVRIYNVDGTGTPAAFPTDGANIWDVSFSPDGQWLAAVQGDHNPKTWIWKLDGSGTVIILRGARTAPLARFSPGGDRIVTPVYGGKTRLWENFDHLTYAARTARSELRGEEEAAAKGPELEPATRGLIENFTFDIVPERVRRETGERNFMALVQELAADPRAAGEALALNPGLEARIQKDMPLFYALLKTPMAPQRILDDLVRSVRAEGESLVSAEALVPMFILLSQQPQFQYSVTLATAQDAEAFRERIRQLDLAGSLGFDPLGLPNFKIAHIEGVSSDVLTLFKGQISAGMEETGVVSPDQAVNGFPAARRLVTVRETDPALHGETIVLLASLIDELTQDMLARYDDLSLREHTPDYAEQLVRELKALTAIFTAA